ncbi:hypothetical protein niasHT_027386 [Heterodera trifolii]|uniref:Glycoside hydrolase family 5 domain-containing protein n=1 Tax=Heterodera trifolii TaxID=157864 RepID=A0ABD2JUH8_9BILA
MTDLAKQRQPPNFDFSQSQKMAQIANSMAANRNRNYGMDNNYNSEGEENIYEENNGQERPFGKSTTFSHKKQQSRTKSRQRKSKETEKQQKGRFSTKLFTVFILFSMFFQQIPNIMLTKNDNCIVRANCQPFFQNHRAGFIKCNYRDRMPMHSDNTNLKIWASNIHPNRGKEFLLLDEQVEIRKCKMTDDDQIHCRQTLDMTDQKIENLEHMTIEEANLLGTCIDQMEQNDAESEYQENRAFYQPRGYQQTEQSDAEKQNQENMAFYRPRGYQQTEQSDADNEYQKDRAFYQPRGYQQTEQSDADNEYQENMASSKMSQNLPYGQLRVEGNKLVAENGQPARLIGVSLFWSQYNDTFWNEESIRQLKCNWHVNVIRAPLAVEPKGYLENPEREMAKLERVIDACSKWNVYLIIDWHLTGNDPHTEEAKKFFDQISKEYGYLKNIIYEIWNEAKTVSWQVMVQHHTSVIDAIRANDKHNLILCGTPKYDMSLNETLQHPLPREFGPLMYTFHWYAADGSGSGGNAGDEQLLAQAKDVYSKGLALFCTEWGLGSGGMVDKPLNYEMAKKWLSWMNENEIPQINWSIYADHNYQSFPISERTTPYQLGDDKNLTPDGRFVKEMIRKWNPQNQCPRRD